MAVFDPTVPVQQQKWLVHELIALGSLGFIFAQAGVGKSYWTEQLAVAVAYNQLFLDLHTQHGDVLLIDEDSPPNTVSNRLAAFYNYKPCPNKFKLHVHSMEGTSFKRNLISTILQYPNVKLVIIDSLISVMDGYDINRTDMVDSSLKALRNQCLHPDVSILITHHISEKVDLSPVELMDRNSSVLSMGSSAINQKADYYFVMSSPNKGGKLEKLFVRPVSKRCYIPYIPFSCTLKSDRNTLHFEELKVFESSNDNLNEVEQDIILFFESSTDRDKGKYFSDIHKAFSGKYSEPIVRSNLKSLCDKGRLTCGKEYHNKFLYTLVPHEDIPCLTPTPAEYDAWNGVGIEDFSDGELLGEESVHPVDAVEMSEVEVNNNGNNGNGKKHKKAESVEDGTT